MATCPPGTEGPASPVDAGGAGELEQPLAATVNAGRRRRSTNEGIERT
jgi:hypothetical protein